MTQIPYDYAAKGRADFEAGKKDERLYGGGDRHNAEYRRGWQQARREKEDVDLRGSASNSSTSIEVPKVNNAAPLAPSDDCPFAEEPVADSQPFKPVPPPTTAAPAFQPPPRPKDGGETATERTVESRPDIPKPPLRPKKLQPDESPQLNLF